MDKTPEIFNGIDKNLLKKFKEYHIENPHTFKKFKEYAYKIKATGKSKYSGWTIINAIRWEHDVTTTGDVFRINNDFIALYVRLLIHKDETFGNFFEMRKMKPSDRRTSDEERYRSKEVTW